MSRLGALKLLSDHMRKPDRLCLMISKKFMFKPLDYDSYILVMSLGSPIDRPLLNLSNISLLMTTILVN